MRDKQSTTLLQKVQGTKRFVTSRSKQKLLLCFDPCLLIECNSKKIDICYSYDEIIIIIILLLLLFTIIIILITLLLPMPAPVCVYYFFLLFYLFYIFCEENTSLMK